MSFTTIIEFTSTLHGAITLKNLFSRVKSIVVRAPALARLSSILVWQPVSGAVNWEPGYHSENSNGRSLFAYIFQKSESGRAPALQVFRAVTRLTVHRSLPYQNRR